MHLKTLSRQYLEFTDKTVVVVASGQSAKNIIPDIVNYPAIVINRGVELLPNADVLYAADSGFWNVYSATIREFHGLKICPMMQAQAIHPSVLKCDILKKDGISVHNMQRDPFGTIGHGGNSGFQAVNLAVQFGAKRILLAGFDYCGDHWHEPHDKRLGNPTELQLRTWTKRFDDQSERLKSWGVEVINLSQYSALKNYPVCKSSEFRR